MKEPPRQLFWSSRILATSQADQQSVCRRSTPRFDRRHAFLQSVTAIICAPFRMRKYRHTSSVQAATTVSQHRLHEMLKHDGRDAFEWAFS
jgi:peroxiredoxin